MAKTPSKPGIGHNAAQALPDQKLYRSALALLVRMDEEKKAMAGRHKRLKSKMIEGNQIPLEDVTDMFKMREAPESDVRRWITRKAHAMGAIFGMRVQADLFTGDPVVLETIRFRGLMAGIEGKAGTPPPTLASDEKQAWMNGWHDGIESRKGVIEEMQKEVEDDPDGDFSEEQVQQRAGERSGVADKAAKDFREDNAPAMPDWKGFDPDHAKWKTSQMGIFVAWFSALPREADNLPLVPDGLPMGVLNAFHDYRTRLAASRKDDGATLDGGVKKPLAAGVGGDVVRIKPGDVNRLDLTPDDFGADSFEEISAANYQGSADFDDYHLIVVKGDGDQRLILKDIVGPAPDEEGDDFEAPPAELAKQNARQAVVGAREVEAPAAAEEPKAKAPRKPRESQSAKAARLAAEAGTVG